MRLSEEIILGGTLAEHVSWPVNGNGDWGCALQLAIMAHGSGELQASMCATIQRHPWTVRFATCPQCGESDKAYYIIAGHLNDLHKWNLDRIAQWVASVEPQEMSAPSPSTTLVAQEAHAEVSAK